MNELLIVLTLLLSYALVLVWLRLFGEKGMYGVMVLVTVAANIEVLIIVNAFSIEMTLGNILFASTFLATDVLSERWGKESASKAALVGVATSTSMIVLTNIWIRYTPSTSDFVFPSIVTVFSNTPRVLVVSLVVFAICQFLDVQLYHLIWKLTGNSKRHMWARNIGATVITQIVNTVLFNLGAFYGLVPKATLISIILSGFGVFVVTSITVVPVTYAARRIANKYW